jgi:hypothetical protein
MAVTLYLMNSAQDAWDNVVRPWFEKVATGGLQKQPFTVVTASRSQAYFFRNRLLAEGKSLFGVKFLSPPQLREFLLRDGDLRVPLREHLRLLLAVTAEEFANIKQSDQTLLTAKSVARDPDRFLRAFDEVRAAGWTFDEIDSPELREIAARFEVHARECGFTFLHAADRTGLAHVQRSQPLFSTLLLFGFDAAHWPLWPLLEAATRAAAEVTVILNDPRDEARDLDEAWIGTWEETFGPAETIAPGETNSPGALTQSLPIPASEIHFAIGRDTTRQARAIVALAAKFLADWRCERLGILFSGPGALPRLVASFLESAGIAHNDGIAHVAASAFDDEAWRAWLELQQAHRIKPLFRFLRVAEAGIFGGMPASQLEDTLQRAYNNVLIDDVTLLSDYCARSIETRDGEAAARQLEKVRFLPERATLTDFLSQTRAAFSMLGWKERWTELERLSRNWNERFTPEFSKKIYLRWLQELFGAPSLQRDDLGANPYARVHLLTYAEAQNQPWSHLIFAGLNDEASAEFNTEFAFVRDAKVEELNRKNKTLNRRASKRGRHGEGHWSVREGKTLLLGPNEQRQVRRREMLNLVESVTAAMGATTSLYSEATPSRIANPNEFFSWLYFNARGRGVSQQTLQILEEQTRSWLKEWSPVDAQKVDSMSVGRTRYAFDARRQLRAAGEYEFALRSPPDQDISLSVTDWQAAVRSPASVWMKAFLGVEADTDAANAWPLATGQWVHRWLADSVCDGNERKFVDVNRANEIRGRIATEAREFRLCITALCTGRGRVLPDWWHSGWSNAFYIADCLAAKVSDLHDWSEMAVEWSLDNPTSIPVSRTATLRVRGRIDLILARQKFQQSQIGYKDLWVVDYKTGRQRGFSLKELRKKDTPERKLRRQLIDGRGVQLALYALAVSALGAQHVQLTLLSPAEELKSQFDLAAVVAQNDFWTQLQRMQETGVFGMLGPVHAEFGFVAQYPLATLPVDVDLLEEKWALTHPAFVAEKVEGSK